MKDCKHKPMRKNCPVCLWKQGDARKALRVAEEQRDKMITLNEKMDKVLLREIPEPSGYAYEDRGTWVKDIDYGTLSYSDEGLIEVKLVITYDFATYKGNFDATSKTIRDVLI